MNDDNSDQDVTFTDEFNWSAGLSTGAEEEAPGSAKNFFGKYRGTVINNVDPMKEGRMCVQVPDALGLGISSWAMPCVPFAGIQSGMYVLPPIGAGVWVEFEQGDQDHPIWVGCFWGTAAEVPVMALPATPAMPVFVVQTPGQNGIAVHDGPIPPGTSGGVVLKSITSSISIGPDGITIVAPNINILGNINAVGTINFNAGALVVA